MTPLAVVSGFVGGLGLFFMGMRLLTQHLKALADRRVRQSAARWTRSRWSGCVWGMVAGAVTQTMPALTFVLIGMLRSGILSTRRAVTILIGGNIGVMILVLLASFDIKLGVFYILGIAQIITVVATRGRTSNDRMQALAWALFGLGLMVFGFVLIRETAAPLANYPWYRETIAQAGRSLLLCVLAGTVLSVLSQSTVVVLVTGISFAAAGILDVEQILALHIGANLGSSLSLYLFTRHLSGQSRQIAMFQVLNNCLLAVMFLPLILIEAKFGVPLIKAALLSFDLPIEQALAVYCLFPNLVTCAIHLVILRTVERRLELLWPTTEIELLSRPWYVHDQILEDAKRSLLMADREQRRLIKIFSCCMDIVRHGTELHPMGETARDVLTRIDEFMHDAGRCFPDEFIDDHVAILTRQRLLFGLNDQILEVCGLLNIMAPNTTLDTWRTDLIEGIDAVLLVFSAMLNEEDGLSDLPSEQFMSGRGELMGRMRRNYLVQSTLPSLARTSVLLITSGVEHLFVLLSQLAQTYREAAGAAGERLVDTRAAPSVPVAAEN